MKPIYLRKIKQYLQKSFECDYFNKKIGHLRVIGISDKTDSTSAIFFICICDCGKLLHSRKSSIKSGRTKSCCNFITVEEEKFRFKDKIQIDSNECWIWKGCLYKRCNGKNSYGRFMSKLHKNEYLAHRISFLLFKGPIPSDVFVCHLCDVENCVNPDHLFLGERLANHLDMIVKDRQAKGEENGSSKYTNKDVLKCRDLYALGNGPKEIASITGFPYSTVQKFIYKESWKHI